MQITYNRLALQQYMDAASAIGESFRYTRDAGANAYHACRQKYTRLHSEIEQMIYRANMELEAAESAARSAAADYNAAVDDANNAEEDSDRGAAMSRANAYADDLAEAERDMARAAEALREAQGKMTELNNLWERHSPRAETAISRMEDNLFSYTSLMTGSNRDLGQYITLMDLGHSSLYETSVTAASSGGSTGTAGRAAGAAAAVIGAAAAVTHGSSGSTSSGSPSGTGSTAVGSAIAAGRSGGSMTAVSMSDSGKKECAMSIGGASKTYACSKAGMAKAYRDAVRSGDQEQIARTSAMFEIETLREELNLTGGDPSVAQVGGYHRDVSKQDPAGYESHHIPSRSVQTADSGWLPSISVTKEDHKLTSSYSGKQGKAYQSFLPDSTPAQSYKQEVSDKLGTGGTGYVQMVRNELYDLRNATGTKYDGGISAYLDAVIDMIATRGIPGNR